MQQFVSIGSGEKLTDSRQEIVNNDLTVMSCNSGTSFPTTNLQVGMFCFRTDLNQLFQLEDMNPTWTMVFDLSKTATSKEYVDAGDATQKSYTDTQVATKVNSSDVVSAAAANKILRLDANGNLPANISGAATSVPWSGVTGLPSAFNPPIASSSTLGGIKAGAGLAVAGDGTASVTVSSVPRGCQLFTSSGTFTVPAGVTSVLVSLVGGGGGGGGGYQYSTQGGGGGAGGVLLQQVSVTPGQQIAVTVGAAGAAGGSSHDGYAGGTSSFGGYISAAGGGGGRTGGNGGGASGGFGGQPGGNGISSSEATSAGPGGGSLFGSGGFNINGGCIAPAGYGAGGSGAGGGGGAQSGTQGMVLVQW